MNDWQSCSLSDLIDVKHGFAFLGVYFRDDPPGDVLLTPGNFAIGGGFTDRKLKYYNGPVSDDFVLSPGELLVSMTDLSKAGDTLGYPAFVPKDDKRYLHNQRLGKVIVKDGAPTSIGFIYWIMRTSSYRDEILASCTGSTVKHTSPSRILAYRFMLPSEAEQQAIAATLGALDEKIALNRRMNETLEAMARAIFKDWFVDLGPTRAKMEGRAPYLTPDIWSLFPDRCDADGKPEGWEQKPLLDFAILISGGTPKTDVGAYWNGDIRWASAKDVSQCGALFLTDTERSITREGYENSSTKLVPKYGTVVVARGATTGRYCMFGREMAMNQTCYGLANEQYPVWLNQSFGATVDALVHAAHGSVFDTITTVTLQSSRIMDAGTRLLQAYEDCARPLYDRALGNIEESRTLAEIRDLLLPKLMSGEIQIKDAEQLVGETT